MFIHLQTFKIRVFNIQIMKNFEVLFWQRKLFVLILGAHKAEFTAACTVSDEPIKLLEIFSGKLSGKR